MMFRDLTSAIFHTNCTGFLQISRLPIWGNKSYRIRNSINGDESLDLVFALLIDQSIITVADILSTKNSANFSAFLDKFFQMRICKHLDDEIPNLSISKDDAPNKRFFLLTCISCLIKLHAHTSTFCCRPSFGPWKIAASNKQPKRCLWVSHCKSLPVLGLHQNFSNCCLTQTVDIHKLCSRSSISFPQS